MVCLKGQRNEKIALRDQLERWSSDNAFVSGVGGLRFKSRTGNGSPPLQNFLEWSCITLRRNESEMSPTNSLHVLV